MNALSPALKWSIFVALSAGAIGGAYRMTRTMSMVRSGIFLMGSFSALAGLFLLLSADLLASMQLMMYIGGMLVMILFMVRMSMDPGGAMMGIAPPEKGESKGAEEKHQQGGGLEHDKTDEQNMQGEDMSEMDMSMTNDFTKPAAVAGVFSSVVLLLLIFSVRWPKAAAANHANAALMVGKELLGRYMIAFEAGALLILLGVVGATIFGGKE
jgi:NADH:ubiquinone oxidoreductase subunit 6 (subunit J)